MHYSEAFSCDKAGLKTGDNSGVTMKIMSECPSNYLASCSQTGKAIRESIARIPGAKSKLKIPDTSSMVTYYYDAANLAQYQATCSNGKWSKK